MSAQTWLTQEAADRLRAELENLEQHGRKDVTAKIEAARAEGDLKENGGYHAARDEQGKMLTAKLVQAWLLLQKLQEMK
jgi:transcription elongation factor GreA